eukprot:NODE_6181_length_523_cov_696.918803.p4 GENE.NODE_6181_length_523_cov_696.918803~~NODE_6181_length_523_cov_696.918803.p4  ORF type:complete len:108 (-),score=56.32 NODE_6181_length_523_cov_696.918803:66-389(-)
MQVVTPWRFLDGIVFAVFLLFISGFGLFIFGHFHRFCVVEKGITIMDEIFPFPKKKFEFNLTHIILFAILVALMSMMHHPAQDVLQAQPKKDLKKDAKKEKQAAKES